MITPPATIIRSSKLSTDPNPIPDPNRDPLLASAVTARSLTIGTFLTVLATTAGTYARFVLHTTRLDQNHLSMAAVFPLVLIVLLFTGRFKLQRGELLVIFCMPLIGSTMPTYFLGKLIANIAIPHYMAGPENQWATYFDPHLPEWAVLPPGEGLRWFYEGIPPGASIPWEIWLTPVFWWITLVAAFYGASLCLMVILRKQWVEHERIDYPLMEMPLAVVEESPEKGFFPIPVMNKPVFWLGFALTMFVVMWNMVTYFSPTFPAIPWQLPSVQFNQFFPPIPLRLYWVVVGFGYFMKLDILFSLWVFDLLTNIEMGTFNRFGYKVDLIEEYSTNPLSIGSQAMGAFIVIVSVGFWMARHHLRDVWRKAFSNAPDIDDSAEIVSYRVAVVGLLVCSLYLLGWHLRTGMGLPFTLMFLFGALVMLLGVTRVIAEAGLVSLRAPLTPQPFGMMFLGTDGLSQRTLVSIALSYTWFADLKTTIMPALAHSTRLFDTIPGRRRRLLWPIVLAMGAGVVSTFAYTIYTGYLNGAANYGGIFAQGLAEYPWDDLVKKSREPFSIRWKPVSFVTIGVVVASVLMFIRYRIPSFPLNPLGFAVGPAIPVRDVILPIFIAWFIKSITLRVGGIQAYRAARPFFIGMILGHFVGAGLSFFVDMIWFPGQGHSVPFSDW
jgi:hypothetical protein